MHFFLSLFLNKFCKNFVYFVKRYFWVFFLFTITSHKGYKVEFWSHDLEHIHNKFLASS